jgi:hypothetical protein
MMPNASPNDTHRSGVRLIFVAGHGRSGSTLLDRLLGATVVNAVSAGEVHRICWWGMNENWACGCGTPFNACEFWHEVLSDVLPSRSRADWLHLWRSVARPQHLPMLLSPGLRTPSYTSALNEYRAFLAAIYSRMSEIADAQVIIDSSTSPIHGLILTEIPDVDLSIIHLTRDSRAVAFSNLRVKVNPAAGHEALMGRRPVFRTGITWQLYAVLSRILTFRAPDRAQLRYEDLVADPLKELQRLGHCLRLEMDFGSFVSQREVTVGPNHMASGNPSRFVSGNIQLRLDDEWKHKMKKNQKLTVTALTALGLLKYGYKLRQ